MDLFHKACNKSKEVGIGGWNCPCCTPQRKKGRVKIRRYARRVLRAKTRIITRLANG